MRIRQIALCAVLMLVAGCSARGREPYRFGSESPDHRCDIIVIYDQSKIHQGKSKLVIHNRCRDGYQVFQQDEDWLPAAVKFHWSDDSSLVTFVACTSNGAGKVLTFDTRLNKLVDDASHADTVREKIRAKSPDTGPAGCESVSDPILWGCGCGSSGDREDGAGARR